MHQNGKYNTEFKSNGKNVVTYHFCWENNNDGDVATSRIISAFFYAMIATNKNTTKNNGGKQADEYLDPNATEIHWHMRQR